MTRLTIRHLRYFDALARHGHFGRAAEDCAISQPALSAQIKELEQIMGASLVERGARQAHLTALGAEFVARARPILRALQELESLGRVARGPLSGHLRLGIIPTVAPYLLPGLIRAAARHWPELDIRPRETVTSRLIRDLAEARLDAAILALPVSEPFLHEEELFAEDFVLVRPAADADRPVPSAEGLREMRLLLLEEGHCFRDQALEFCAREGPAPRELMEGSSLATLVQMVGAGMGVTLIPEMAVPVETRAADVALARLAPPRPQRTIGMVWRRTSPLGPQLAALADCVREIGLAAREEARAIMAAAPG